MAARQYEIGDAELEVLRVLWQRGPSTVRDVLSALHARGRRLAYTTVLTVLTRLEQKGCVASNRRGVAYVYRATVSRDRLTQSRVRALLEQLYDGAAGPLALQLIQSERLTPEEIDELHRLIERLDAKGKRVRD